MNLHRMGMVLALGTWACRIDAVDSLDAADPPRAAPSPLAIVPEADGSTPEIQHAAAALRRNLGVLAGPHFGGRRPGSAGAQDTVRFLVGALYEMHLQPAAEDGGWLQDVPLRVVRSAGVVELLVGEDRTPLEGIQVARTQSEGRFELTADLEDVGYGITAPEWSFDDYAGKSVEGDAVLARAGVPAEGPSAIPYGSTAYKRDRALRAGASACLVWTDAPADDWDALLRDFTRPRIFASAATDPMPPSVEVAGIVSSATAQLLVDAAQKGDARLAFTVDTAIEQWDESNVVARIAGAERPAQSVVVVAHWDAGGHAEPVQEGAGADDNATGVAIALAVADRAARVTAAGHRPLRSIVFVFTAAGSLGGHGARRYVSRGVADPRNVAGMIVLDGFPVRDPLARTTVVGAERSSLDEMLESSFGKGLQRASAGHAVDPDERRVFDDAGILAIGVTRRSAEGDLADVAFDPTTDTSSLATLTTNVFDLVWLLANEPAMPARLQEPGEAIVPAADPN